MADIRYRIRTDDYLSHAVVYKDKRKNVSITKDEYTNTKSIIGRSTGREFKPTKSVYKNPNYDPVKRHERYLEEKGMSGSGGSSGSRGSGGSSGSRGSGGSSALSSKISKMSEELSLSSDVQREVARRKIADLQNQLKERIQELRKKAYSDSENEQNTAERRMITKRLGDEIKALQGKTSDEVSKISKDLSNWITKEQEALNKRIASLQGKKYDPNAKKVKEQQQKKRDKEVNSRADAIYKSKTKKK